MTAAHDLDWIHLQLCETLSLSSRHCSTFRQTIGENREIVAQTIDTILDSKEAMRRADEALGIVHDDAIDVPYFLGETSR